MSSTSRLGRQIEEVIASLNAIGARVALIGGLALASHKPVFMPPPSARFSLPRAGEVPGSAAR